MNSKELVERLLADDTLCRVEISTDGPLYKQITSTSPETLAAIRQQEEQQALGYESVRNMRIGDDALGGEQHGG